MIGRNKKKQSSTYTSKKKGILRLDYPPTTPTVDLALAISLLTDGYGRIGLEYLTSPGYTFTSTYDFQLQGGHAIGMRGALLSGEKQAIASKLAGVTLYPPPFPSTYESLHRLVKYVARLVPRWPRVLLLIAEIAPQATGGFLGASPQALKGVKIEEKGSLAGPSNRWVSLYKLLTYIGWLDYGSGLVLVDGARDSAREPEKWLAGVVAGQDMVGLVFIANAYTLPEEFGVNLPPVITTQEIRITLPGEGKSDAEQ